MKEKTSARSGPRLPVTLEGTLLVGSGDGARSLRVVTCDLGTGGASITLPEPLVVGTAVTLRLVLAAGRDGTTSPLELPAIVARLEDDAPCRCALRFTATRPAAVETLKRFMLRARDDRRR